MSLGHEHGLVLIGLAGPMDVVDFSLSLSYSQQRPMRTNLSCCLGLIDKSRGLLLVWKVTQVPHMHLVCLSYLAAIVTADQIKQLLSHSCAGILA